MTIRRALPARRSCETFEIQFGGLSKSYVVSVGFYETGEIGEIFISNGKSGEQVEAIARDFAIAISMVLQHGGDLVTIQKALTRDSFDQPQSIGAAVVDRLVQIQRERLAA
jgi:hypothetical protein